MTPEDDEVEAALDQYYHYRLADCPDNAEVPPCVIRHTDTITVHDWWNKPTCPVCTKWWVETVCGPMAAR